MLGRNLGDLGESVLRLWAAQVGAAINPAIQDRRGWDFLVEFPREEKSHWPSLDVRPPEIQCLVQVKATSSSRSRKSIKIANWERLVKTPLPAFFLVLRFRKSTNDLAAAYLIHVGEKWIAKVLRRLRLETSQGTTDLSQKTIDLVWKGDEQLSDPGGSSLHDAIRKAVGSALGTYSKNKAQLLEEMGEPTTAEMTFTKTGATRAELLEEWVDLAIGLRDSIEVSQFEHRADVRFGIPIAITTHEGGDLTILDRSKEGSDIKLVIRNNLINRASRFDAKLHTPHNFFPGDPVPVEYFKARIVFPIGEVIVRPYDQSMRINVDFSKSPTVAPLELYGEIWRLAHILNSVSAEGCTVELFKPDEAPSEFPLAPSSVEPIDPYILWLSTVVDNALFVASYLGGPVSAPLAFDQLIEQAELFQQVRAFCDPNLPISKVMGVLQQELGESDRDRAIAIVKRLKYGDAEVLVCTGLSGPTRIGRDEQGRLAFEIVQPRTLFARSRLDPTDDESANALLDETVAKLEERGFEVIRMEDPWDRPVGSV